MVFDGDDVGVLFSVLLSLLLVCIFFVEFFSFLLLLLCSVLGGVLCV